MRAILGVHVWVSEVMDSLKLWTVFVCVNHSFFEKRIQNFTSIFQKGPINPKKKCLNREF